MEIIWERIKSQIKNSKKSIARYVLSVLSSSFHHPPCSGVFILVASSILILCFHSLVNDGSLSELHFHTNACLPLGTVYFQGSVHFLSTIFRTRLSVPRTHGLDRNSAPWLKASKVFSSTYCPSVPKSSAGTQSWISRTSRGMGNPGMWTF